MGQEKTTYNLSVTVAVRTSDWKQLASQEVVIPLGETLGVIGQAVAVREIAYALCGTAYREAVAAQKEAVRIERDKAGTP